SVAVDGLKGANQAEAGPPTRPIPASRPAGRSPSHRAGSHAQGVKPPFGVLLIAGGATHQENYAAALAADPRCRLVGLADEPGLSPRRQAWNERLAHELKIPVLPDLDAALARDDVQVVSVCA